MPAAAPSRSAFEPVRYRLASFGDRPCLVTAEETVSYAAFAARIADRQAELAAFGVVPGTVVALRGDYSGEACAALFALAALGAVIVPLGTAAGAGLDERLGIADVEILATVTASGLVLAHRPGGGGRHPLMARLIDAGAAGLVLFSSGSTGRSKASLLDLDRLMGKFRRPPGRAWRTLVFLLLDHIGGINTLLHTLAQGGTIVTPGERTPEAVCQAIAAHRIELLPTTPTFLNMLLIAEAHRRHDLSSLRLITYGTEPMPPATLAAVAEALPDAILKQTYGLSELGILPTRSKDSTSLWMKLGSDGFEHKVVDGVLWVRADTAMLGYLNAPQPFDAEGWFDTQDMVETDGEYLRVLGRRSEVINVGGEKVHPVEVESVLLAAGNVRDALVYGRSSPITGQVVAAQVALVQPEDPAAAARRLRQACTARLERYKVPVGISVVDGDLFGERFKKRRTGGAGGSGP